MALREHEIEARDAFDRHLHTLHGNATPKWSEGDDPPDLRLQLRGRDYAVEVTQLIVQYNREDRPAISEWGVGHLTARLADGVEQEAIKRGILRGVYCITMDCMDKRFRDCRQEVSEIALKYIAQTQGADFLDMTLLSTANGQQFFLGKFGNSANEVGHAFFSGAGGWEGDIRGELISLVEDATAEKARKLGAKSVPRPWSLLLLDRHCFARDAEYAALREAVAAAALTPGSDASRFDAIHVIDHGGRVHCLWESPAWETAS